MSGALESPRVRDVLDRLRALGLEQDPEYGRRVRARESEVGGPFYGLERAEMGADAPQAVAEAVGRILYGLVITTRPDVVVEFGTSYGVSTIYLAAGLRDVGAGRLIATELIEQKADAAVANVVSAGFADLVDIRHGDARRTLASLDVPVDLLFLDGSNDLYVSILRMLGPRLAPGAVIVADLSHGDPYHERYRTYVGGASETYLSVELPIEAGLVISTRR